jgi:hypothetical protein
MNCSRSIRMTEFEQRQLKVIRNGLRNSPAFDA